jgi:hypothetical protein
MPSHAGGYSKVLLARLEMLSAVLPLSLKLFCFCSEIRTGGNEVWLPRRLLRFVKNLAKEASAPPEAREKQREVTRVT